MKWKIAALLLLVALPGVFATSWLALPMLVEASQIPVPMEILQVATAIQNTILVLIAAVIGTSLAPKVGLTSPAIYAIANGGSVIKALRPQIIPGLMGGAIGAVVILGFYTFAPESLMAIQPESPLPLAVRVLYGGITEEVLIRWGLMTAMAWAGWRVLNRYLQQPSSGVMWAAITVSAFAFGLSHLPSVAPSLSELSAYVVAYITIGNALFGLVAGYLFWRYGLEAAIVAHVSAHVLAFAVRG